MKLHVLPFTNPPGCDLLDYIRKKIKTVEGRTTKYKINVGDVLLLNDVLVRVKYVNKYDSLEDYLNGEGLNCTMPCVKTIDEAVKIYNMWSTSEQRKDGFLGIGIEVFGEEFPLKRNYVTDEEIRNKFENLKKYDGEKRIHTGTYYQIRNIKISHLDLVYNGHGPLLLLSKPEDYDNINILSDMFNEANRMKARRYNFKQSPWDYYFTHKRELAEDALKNHGEITPRTLREALYYLNIEATSFRPTNLAFIIDMFKAKSILDPSAGWGDRLLAAMSRDVRYVGVDPNTKVHPVYQEMIEFFNKDPQKYTMICAPIETAELPEEEFDLVFTSPPYFDLEIYSDEKTQSISGLSTQKEWFDKFLTVMIDKCVAKLKEGGRLVLVINQKNKQEKYIQWMLDYIKLHYFGVISYSDEKISSPQPMWIWQKCVKIPMDLYNPPIKVIPVISKKRVFNIVRDDFLIGGTKQRGLVEMMTEDREYIYAGPVFGYAQIALAIAAKYNKVQATVFVEKRKYMHPLTKRAQSLGAKIVEVKNGYLKKVQQAAEVYESENPHRKLMPFGLHDKEFHNIMVKNIKSAWKDDEPKRMWLVAGSAVILNILFEVFPNTQFIAVQVGKKIWPDQINDRTKLIISDEPFIKRAKVMPPYPSVSNYDAKLWKYVVKYGKDGDYVWNVGRDLPRRPIY